MMKIFALTALVASFLDGAACQDTEGDEDAGVLCGVTCAVAAEQFGCEATFAGGVAAGACDASLPYDNDMKVKDRCPTECNESDGGDEDGPPACVAGQFAALGEGAGMSEVLGLLCGDDLVTTTCGEADLAEIAEQKEPCDLFMSVYANTLCPAENPLQPDVVTPETFNCVGGCCTQKDACQALQWDPTVEGCSEVCREEMILAQSQGIDICAEVDAKTQDACGTAGGAWVLNEDMSNKQCSELQSEMHAMLTTIVAFASMDMNPGQPLDPAPDMSMHFTMVTGMFSTVNFVSRMYM